MDNRSEQSHPEPENGPMATPRRKQLSPAAQSEIEQRRTYTLQGILNPERQGKLFEHFVVTGLPSKTSALEPISPLSSPQARRKAHSRHTSTATNASSEGWAAYTPEILFCYPPSEKVKKLMIQEFTFPEGMSSDNVKKVATEIEMNQLVFAPLSTVEESNSSFVFLLTTEDALLYGICVIHEELVRDKLSFDAKSNPEQQEDAIVEEDGGGFVVAPRCYMFLTKYPFFHTYFEVLYSVLAQERTHRMFARLGVPHESEVISLLDQFASMAVPSGEQKLEIKLKEETLTFTVPAGDEDSQLIDFCFVCLLKLLTLDQLLLVLAAILQECQVLIVSRQISIISALVMGLVPLMRPYVWQGTFIPVIPASLDECMHSPMPYIMGVQSLSEDDLHMLEETLILDVDQGRILRTPPPAMLTPLPFQDSLRSKLQPLHDLIYKPTASEREQCYLQPYSNSAKDIEICHCALSAIRNYHKDLHHIILSAMEKIPRFNLAKPRHITKLIVEVGYDEYVPFLKRFLTTQHWNFFYENVKLRDDSMFQVNGTHSRAIDARNDAVSVRRSQGIASGANCELHSGSEDVCTDDSARRDDSGYVSHGYSTDGSGSTEHDSEHTRGGILAQLGVNSAHQQELSLVESHSMSALAAFDDAFDNNLEDLEDGM